ncbi:hypothetical protein BJ508DRAFT_411960 [Ascobolus immersus RN42]|uniref:N-acetyltransferase domain-containing protein n=1 Tax=Ascobolus immersus RN42 TaxID=1160509 RepID=A0A3N4IHD2_ASCIM|nr:hypothetical protein BJ508DRAFT_411960 [Ascobolus immersus RN42]
MMGLPGMDKAFLMRFIELRGPRLERVYKQEFAESDGRHWDLFSIRVDPVYQRRGIGKRLMEWGQDMARSDGVGMAVEGTESGSKLYASVGFREVERWHDLGGIFIMVWTPEKTPREIDAEQQS